MGKIGKALVGGVTGFISSGGNPLGAVAGAASGLMSSSGQSAMGSAPGSIQTTTPQIPAWLQPQLEYQVNTARSLSEQPYVPYTGQRVAQLTPDELQAMQLSRNLSGGADLSAAQVINQQVAQRGLQGFDQTTLNQYMNPYQQNVMDISRQRQLDQFDLAKRGLQQQQGATGAFGGSRAGLAQGQLYDNFSRQLAEQEANQLYQGYNDAQNRAFQGTQLAGQAAGQMGQQGLAGYQTQLQGMNALGSAGALDRGIQQQGLDVNYQNFITEQQYPYEQLSYLQGIVNPIAGLSAGRTTTGQETGGPGYLQQAAGVGSLVQGFGGAQGLLGGLFGGGGTQNAPGMGQIDWNGGGLYGGGYSTGGNLGTINWFKDGGQVQGFAQGGLVKGYQDGGSVLDGLSNWLNNYINIGNDKFKAPVPEIEALSKSTPEPSYNNYLGNSVSQGLSNLGPSAYRGLEAFANWADPVTSVIAERARHPSNLLTDIPAALIAAPLATGALGLGAATTGAGAKVIPSLAKMAIKHPSAASALGLAAKYLYDQKPSVSKQAGTNPQLEWQDAMAKLPNKSGATGDVNAQVDALFNGIVSPMARQEGTAAPIDLGANVLLPNQGTSRIPESQTPAKKDTFNAPLVSFGAAMLGSRGNFYQALSEGANAYKTEITNKEAAIAKAAQQAIDNARKQQSADSYTAQVQGQLAGIPLSNAKKLADIALAKSRAANMGGSSKLAGDLLKQALNSGSVDLDNPEAIAAAAEQSIAAANRISGVNDMTPDYSLEDLLSRQQQLMAPPAEAE